MQGIIVKIDAPLICGASICRPESSYHDPLTFLRYRHACL